MAGPQAIIDQMLVGAPIQRKSVTGPAPSVAERMFKRLLRAKAHPGQTSTSNHALPRPIQLALPFLGGSDDRDAGPVDEHVLSTEPLFREARPVEPVLSYEQASLEQIVPGAEPAQAMPHDRLILPGGMGLILYESSVGAMAFDWMRWSRKRSTGARDANADCLGATIDAQALRKGSRVQRRMTRYRCIIPLTRYSIPVRNGAMWSHRWISPMDGPVACAAGVWSAERGAGNMFAMVTGLAGQDADGPLILTEDEMLLWLRAPLNDALTIITERRARSDASAQR